jgi:hypothetical protein
LPFSNPTEEFFQFCSTFETLLWILSVLLETTSGILCLDDDHDDEDEDNTDINRQIGDNELEVLSVWWKICADITNLFTGLVCADERQSLLGSLPTDVLVKFLNLWVFFPPVLKPIEGEFSFKLIYLDSRRS